jgi:hypothetical protein
MGDRKQRRCKVLKDNISQDRDRISNFMRDVFENYAELDERYFSTHIHYHKKKKGKPVKLEDHYFWKNEKQNEAVLFAAMMRVIPPVAAIREQPFKSKHRKEKKGTKQLDFWVYIPKGRKDTRDIVLLIEYKHASVSSDDINPAIESINVNDVNNKLDGPHGLQAQYVRLGKEAYNEFVDWDGKAKTRNCYNISLLSIALTYKFRGNINEPSAVNSKFHTIVREDCNNYTGKIIQKSGKLRKYNFRAICWPDTKLQKTEFKAEEATARKDAEKKKKTFNFEIYPAVLFLARVGTFRY